MPRVRLVAKTEFIAPDDVPWTTDADGGAALVEFAGRACYQSWDRSNPMTNTNATFLHHLLDVGHLAAFEHGSASLYLTELPRSLTHELIRHRHFSYSQLSQRTDPTDVVEPDLIAQDPELHARFVAATEASLQAYEDLVQSLEKTVNGRRARQIARSVLPNATGTEIVVTGNYRSWRHFIAMRATEHINVELRELAVACLRELTKAAPNAFADFVISTLPDGTEVASSPLVVEG
ncbi:FAD-dependent thymidylate synthase [Lentzea sp. NPDC051208]|uniref:FAD-dependent thymidylate synthase n=1 Tax=Lentzea sp. NPDC051208 TaxID=3154642 RepID=UPI003419E769